MAKTISATVKAANPKELFPRELRIWPSSSLKTDMHVLSTRLTIREFTALTEGVNVKLKENRTRLMPQCPATKSTGARTNLVDKENEFYADT